jgi:uncharacterized protein YerC
VAQLSKKQLDIKVEGELIKTLDIILVNINSQNNMNSFLVSLLTPTERLMLAKRIAAIVMIKEGLTQSQISSSLHLTQATVSKLELMAKANGEGFDLAFSILEREKIFSDIKNTLIKLAGYTIRAAGGHVKPTII